MEAEEAHVRSDRRVSPAQTMNDLCALNRLYLEAEAGRDLDWMNSAVCSKPVPVRQQSEPKDEGAAAAAAAAAGTVMR